MAQKVFGIRFGAPNDAQALSEIASTTFCDTFGHLYPAEDLNNYISNAYTEETMKQELEDSKRKTLFIFDQANPSKLCGYAMLHFGSHHDEHATTQEDALEIQRFYITKDCHGSGAAYVLMDRVAEIIKQDGNIYVMIDMSKRYIDIVFFYSFSLDSQVVWLGVWENNLRAQKFYNKYNFYEVGEHEFHIGKCRDRDLIFELKRN